MPHFLNWLYWCWECKAIMSWNVGYVSTRELTDEEKEYGNSIDIEKILEKYNERIR